MNINLNEHPIFGKTVLRYLDNQSNKYFVYDLYQLFIYLHRHRFGKETLFMRLIENFKNKHTS
jgi:hypothetical protein